MTEFDDDFGIGNDFERARREDANHEKLAKAAEAFDRLFDDTSAGPIRPTGRRLSSGRDYMVPMTDDELAEAAINYLRRALDSDSRQG